MTNFCSFCKNSNRANLISNAGIQTDEHFHKKLKGGYRMERPEKCPKYIYDEIMTECWRLEPDQRPNFDLIYEKIYELLDQSTKSSYVDIENFLVKPDESQCNSQQA